MASDPDALAFGDIVPVPVPITDQSANRRRPAVVIGGSDRHAMRQGVILMPATSQLRGRSVPAT